MTFLVVFNSDAAPIEQEDLQKAATSKQNVMIVGRRRQIAFIWKETAGSVPLDLERRLWVIGRVRLDDREPLRAKLNASPMDGDALLCLRAYAAWHEGCLEHLQGDFCFAIWDADQQKLFCARDQLGVRPLFYARSGTKWLVSDALESIISNSNLGGELDEYWIADFLTAGFCLEIHRTVYKKISRVPPAHALTASRERHELRRYWELQIDRPLFCRDKRQYFDQFHEFVTLAIRDRLPQGRVGVAMSGGLDSTTLAAKTVMATGDVERVVADTAYYEYLIPDEEKHFSSLVASQLGIRHTLRAADRNCYDHLWYTREISFPEPTTSIISAANHRVIAEEMAGHAHVWFWGEGPDNALTFEWQAYLRWLWNRRDWPHLTEALAKYVSSKSAREWRTTIDKIASLRRRRDEIAPHDAPLEWLDADFVKKLDLAARLRDADDARIGEHPWRPRAVASFNSGIWPAFLEGFDPTFSGQSLDWRHPYLDLRVLKFMLSVPPIPWGRRKRLIREAMKGMLPSEVLERDKAPLSGDPVAMIMEKHPFPATPLSQQIRQYVNEAKAPNSTPDPSKAWDFIKIRALDHWIKKWNRAIY